MLKAPKEVDSSCTYSGTDARKLDAVKEGTRLPIGVLPQVVEAYQSAHCRHGKVRPEDAT
jgi:hypothetical protein